MMIKISIFLTFLLILSISSLSFASGEMEPNSPQLEHDPSKDLSELLKDEGKFFSNQKSGDFQTNFVRKATQGTSNSILIKEGTLIKLSGTIDRSFSTILVEGNLRIIDTGDSAFLVQKIIIAPGGSLTIGDNQNPIKADKKVEIVFLSNNDGEVGIFVFGKLWIHGKEVTPTFVGLEKFAKKWDKRIVVDSELKNWKRDDVVIITSPGADKCNEVSKISRIVNQDIILQNQLNCSHISMSETETSITSHIALLSRNVVISSEDEDNRGSVNFFHGSYGYIKYAQFDKLGPKEVLGRYPIHFHHLKDSSRGIEVIGNSITNSDNRWVTIHDSNGILVKNNVGYNSQGHGFFLEDGNEFDNIFEKNIGIITKPELIISHSGSSIFWTMNPMNSYRDNVAVSAQYWGFFLAIPDEEVTSPNTDEQINLRSLPSLEFEGNTAYNNRVGGMKVSRPVIENEKIYSSEIMISNFNAMGSIIRPEGHFGIRILGSDISISNSSLINHKFGILMGGENIKVIDTEIKMEYNAIPDTEISGIRIDGANNWIENSEIKGYISKNGNDASDISISNNQNQKRLLSAKIINTTLLDPKPFHFGNPVNEKSYLEIYGYNAPYAQTSKVPENFILKKIGSDTIEQRGEYNSLSFDAMIKLLPDAKSENQFDIIEEPQSENYEKTESEIIEDFKNKAIMWGKNNLTDEKFLGEIEILFESRIIEIGRADQDSFNENEFVIPHWLKKLVGFWSEESISDQEFINALVYVLKSNFEQSILPY